MGLLRNLTYWLAYLGQTSFQDPIVVGQEEHQTDLAAIAGPRTETGYRLPVRIELHSASNAPRGQVRVQCWIADRLVGELDDNTAIRLREAVGSGERAGRPIAFDGYIVGGGTGPDEEDESDYGVIFSDSFGDETEDKEMEELLELER
jgi:hypothetical protein